MQVLKLAHKTIAEKPRYVKDKMLTNDCIFYGLCIAVTPVGQTDQTTIIEAGVPGREEEESRSRLATANNLVDDLKGY